MTALPEDVVADLSRLIAELEQRLESSFAAHDAAIAQQVATAQENAQLRAELGLARDRQNASAEILRTIAGMSGDAERSLYQIAETSAHLFGATSATIQIAEGDGWAQTIRVGDTSKRVGAEVPAALLKIGGRNMPGTIVAENRQIHVPDLDNVDPSIADWPGLAPSRAAGTRTMCGSPLRREGKAIGVLIVYRDRLLPFTDEELALQQSFADQAAIAFENARLFNETKETLERQSATADILKVIAGSPSDVQPVFDAIVNSAATLFQPCAATITTLKDGKLHWNGVAELVPSFDHKAAEASYPIPFDPDRAPSARAVLERRIIEIPDTEAPDTPEITRTIAADGGFRSITFVPLVLEDKGVGTIILTHPTVGFKHSNKQLALIQTFADQAVIAIENARLFNETQEALEQQKASADILRVVSNSVADTQPVFDEILRSIEHLFDAEERVIFLAGDDGLLHIGATHGPNSDRTRAQFPAPLETTASAVAMRERRLIGSADVFNDPAIPTAARERARRFGKNYAMVVAPMLWEDRAIGSLLVARTSMKPFGERECNLLRSFADQAVIAIQNARLFNETKEALERQTATAEILNVIASSPTDVQPVFDAIAASGHRLVGGFSTSVFSIVDDMLHLSAFTPTNPSADAALKASFPRPLSGETWNDRIRNGETVEISDVETDPSVPEGVRETWRMRGLRSLLLVPLVRSQTTIGMISATRARPGTFASHHVQLLQTFADQAVIAIENTRLFNEVQQRTNDLSESLQQQTAVGDVLKTISRSTFDLQPVLDSLVNTAALLCDAEMAFIMRREGEVYRAGAAVGFSNEYIEFLKGNPLKVNRGSITGRAVLERRTVQILDVATDPEYTLREATTLANQHTALCVPLLREDEPIGAVVLARQRVEPFTPKQIELVTTFADQAVIAIENVRLFDEVRQRTDDLSESLQQQTATADVLKVISRSAFDLQTVLDTLVESAARLCEADMAAITRRIGEAYYRAGSYGFPEQFTDYIRDLPVTVDRRTITGRTLLEGNIVHVTDVLTDPDYDFEGQQLSGNPRSFLGVPLLREGTPVGALTLTRLAVKPFTEKQIELIATFADQAVIAIENVRLFDEVQAKTRDLTEALEYQTAIGDVLNVISRSPNNLQPVMETIVHTTRRLCQSDYALMLHRESDGVYRIAAHSNASKELTDWMQDNPVVAGDGSAVGIVAAEKQTVHLPDALADPRFTDLRRQRHSKARTMLGVPLLRGREVIGVVFLARTEVKPFSDKQIDLVTNFADQAVIAIENVRLFDEVQAKTRDLTEALTYQTGSGNILRVIASSPTDVKPVLTAIVESACELCEADDALATLRDGDELVFQAQHGSIPVVWKRQPIDREGAAGLAVINRAPVHVHDLLAPEGEQFPRAREFARTTNVRTVLCVPLLREGESIGAIVLRRTEVRPFSDKQITLLQTFADQAVIAIGNVRLFEQVQQRTRELAASLDDLRTAQDRLVQTEKLASLGQLTAGIAHEIKNPLNFVNNFAALSAELTDELNDALKPAALSDAIRAEVDELTGLLKDNLEKVVQHGKRADSIVKNMLLHSREGSGDHRPADINALIDESLNLAYHGARAERPGFNVTLQRDFDPDAGMLEVFPQEITRVFLNLVSNGFYAVAKRKNENSESGFDPILSATTRNLGDSVEIRIRDNGTGIPPEVKDKMFNPFFTTKPAGEGTGLGLSMSHDIIVKQHGGTIDVETEPGNFTEFRIVLPRTSMAPNKNRGQT